MRYSKLKQLKTFLDFVEIQTKLASILPFLLALAYAFRLTGKINIRSSLIYLAAALLFDMSVTAINNYLDNREKNTTPHFSRRLSLIIIFTMIIFAGVLGLHLAYLHGLAVLLAGVLCFIAGITYTYGPAPISKSPYGEAVSGFVMGFIIMFIVVSINAPIVPIIDITAQNWQMRIDIALDNLSALALVSVPAVCLIANIMLANNICDLEADKPSRYTLPRHIGIANALTLFAALNYLAYLAIATACALRMVPVWCLITLVTIFPVQKNINTFTHRQVKPETFSLSVKNFLIIMLSFTLSLLLGSFLPIG